jgi:signal peptidase I
VARGAIVVTPQPRSEGLLLGLGRPLIVKRVIGLPLEEMAFQRGQLFIGGVEFTEPWVDPAHQGTYSMPTRLVPAGGVFLAGDNRLPLASSDSRQFGPLPTSSLRGRLVAQLRLPWGPEGLRWPLKSLL